MYSIHMMLKVNLIIFKYSVGTKNFLNKKQISDTGDPRIAQILTFLQNSDMTVDEYSGMKSSIEINTHKTCILCNYSSVNHIFADGWSNQIKN